jgi:multiple antibiotic resistance protein
MATTFAGILTSIVLMVTTLFPIVNPLSGAPIFLALTADASGRERKIVSWRVARNSFFLLLGALLVGSHVLSFFGISLPIVQVGGGLVVFSSGWAMLKHDDEADRKEIGATVKPGAVLKKAFYPLTLPLTVGPGSIATAITLGANTPHPGGSRLALGLVAAVVGAAVISLSVYLCYAFADRTVRLLGPSAVSVIVRLSAFLLTCVGLQIVWNGLRVLVHTL